MTSREPPHINNDFYRFAPSFAIVECGEIHDTMTVLSKNLPSGTSPTLVLTHPTDLEQVERWKINGQIWRGSMSMETYIRRERHLANQAFTVNGGITFWILIDSADPPPAENTPRQILASCETFRKRALVINRGGNLEECISHGVGSVFCKPEYRNKGYAARMMKEVGTKLKTWQQPPNQTARFSVLFSDIGKKFYARSGWNPFPSSHIALQPLFPSDGPAQHKVSIPLEPKALYAKDIPALCEKDESLLRTQMAQFDGPHPYQVALIPDAATIQWHHAREEFAAYELSRRNADYKGSVVVSEEGERIWCIWTRTFGSPAEGNTLHILRLVIDGDSEPLGRVSEPVDEEQTWSNARLMGIAAVLRAAQLEAAEWGMKEVQIWNPSEVVQVAVRDVLGAKEGLVHRDAASITCLRWYGNGEGEANEIEWVANEKYGWC
ncbi:hypothetical protein MMC09_006877 [Bachmanniomyces sp. S44760]|nr:hypothetical protein [Bachmanniomyces sp. S44760]